MLRVARADRRGMQIIFSKNACILCMNGRFYFTFQAFDLLSQYPIINAHVRMIAVFHEVTKNAPALWQTRVMRITRPDDQLGARLWLSVPNIILHEIDAWSPLAPSELTRPPKVSGATCVNRFPHPPQRACDARAGERSQSTCIVCGNIFPTETALRLHIQYAAMDEQARNRPEEFGHRGLDPRQLTRKVILRNTSEANSQSKHVLPKTPNDISRFPVPSKLTPTKDSECSDHRGTTPPYFTVTPESIRNQIRHRFETRNIEVICIIEGTDPHTANTFQARHSYVYSDIEYDAQHAPCLGLGADYNAEVNLSEFHKVYRHNTVNVEEPLAFATHT